MKKKSPGRIHIPLSEDDALRLLLKVRPTADMPRQSSKLQRTGTAKAVDRTSQGRELKHPETIKGNR